MDPEAYLEEILSDYLKDHDLVSAKKKPTIPTENRMNKVSIFLSLIWYRAKNDS